MYEFGCSTLLLLCAESLPTASSPLASFPFSNPLRIEKRTLFVHPRIQHRTEVHVVKSEDVFHVPPLVLVVVVVLDTGLSPRGMQYVLELAMRILCEIFGRKVSADMAIVVNDADAIGVVYGGFEDFDEHGHVCKRHVLNVDCDSGEMEFFHQVPQLASPEVY